jgi:HPt (histidine-containing phosphotransfer) domain-containing protein
VKILKQCQSASSAPIPSEDPFEELRDLFFARLRSDRVRLTTFAAALAHTEGDPSCTFQDIQLFAHRLRGGAAIFETPEVGNAANALEQAAAAASVAHADRSDASVWTALEDLLDRLAAVNGQQVQLTPVKKE